MTTLIAGCGDLGLNVAQRLIAQGERVIGLRRNPPTQTPAPLSAQSPLLQWLAADLTQPESLRVLSTQAYADVSRVVYCVTPDQRNREAYQAAYVQGLQNLFDVLSQPAAPDRTPPPTQHKHGNTSGIRWLFISSTAVYGPHTQDALDAWVNELTPTCPDQFNGQVLLDAEAFILSQTEDAIVMRLSGIYGPSRTQIVDRIKHGLAQAPVEPVFWTNRIHIDDAAQAIVHILGLPHPERCYIVTDCQPTPMNVLYQHIADSVGAPKVKVGPPPAGMHSKRLSCQRLLDSGFKHQWPDAIQGYSKLIGRSTHDPM